MGDDDRVREAAERTRRGLCDLLTGPPADIADGLRQAFFDFGSATPDNVACMDRIEFGTLPPADGRRSACGLRLHRNGMALSDVLWALEGCAIPAELERELVGFGPQDWDAVTRVVTMVFSALERTEPGE